MDTTMYFLWCILSIVCLLPLVSEITNRINQPAERINVKKFAFASINAKRSKNREKRAKRASENKASLCPDIVNNIANALNLVQVYAIVMNKEVNTVIRYINNIYSERGLEAVISTLSCVSQIDPSVCFRYANYYDQLMSNAKQNGYFPLSDLIESRSKHESKTSSIIQLFAMPQIHSKYPLIDIMGKYSSSIDYNNNTIQFEAQSYRYIDESIKQITSQNEIKTETQKTNIMKALFRIYPLTNRNSSLNDPKAINRNFIEQLTARKVEPRGFERVDMGGKAQYLPLIEENVAIDYLNGIEANYPKHLDPYCESNLAHSSDKNGISFDRAGNAITNATLNFKTEFGYGLCQSDYIALLIAKANHSIDPVRVLPLDDQFKGIISVGINRNIFECKAFTQLIAKTLCQNLECKNYIPKLSDFPCPSQINEIKTTQCSTKLSDFVRDYENNVPCVVNVMANLQDLEELKQYVIIKNRMGKLIDSTIASNIIANKSSLFNYYVSDAACKHYYHAKLNIPLKLLAKYKNIIQLTKNYTITSFDTNNNSDFMNAINKNYRLNDTNRYEDKDIKYSHLFRLSQFKNNLHNLTDQMIEKELLANQMLSVDYKNYSDRRTYYSAINKAIKERADQLHSEIRSKRKFLMQRKKGDKAKRDDEVRAFNELIETFNTIDNYKLDVEKSSDMKKISYVKKYTGRRSKVFERDYAFYYDNALIDALRQRSLINTNYKVGRQQRGCSNRILAKTVSSQLVSTDALFPIAQKVLSNASISESELRDLLKFGASKGFISKIFKFHAIKISKTYADLLTNQLLELNVKPISQIPIDNFTDYFIIMQINKKNDAEGLKFDRKVKIIEQCNSKLEDTKNHLELFEKQFELESQRGNEWYLYLSTSNSDIIEEVDKTILFAQKQMNFKIKVKAKEESEQQQLRLKLRVPHYESELDFMFYLYSLNLLSESELISKICSFKRIITKTHLTKIANPKMQKYKVFEGKDNKELPAYKEYLAKITSKPYFVESYDTTSSINAFYYYKKYDIHSQTLFDAMKINYANVYACYLLTEDNKEARKAFGFDKCIIKHNFSNDASNDESNLMKYMNEKYSAHIKSLCDSLTDVKVCLTSPRETLNASKFNVIANTLKSENGGKIDCNMLFHIASLMNEEKIEKVDNKSSSFESTVMNCENKHFVKSKFIARDPSAIVRNTNKPIIYNF